MKAILFLALNLCCTVLLAQGKEYEPPKIEKKDLVEFQPGIWMSRTEVSISEYQAFLAGIKSGEHPEDTSKYALDDSVWVRGLNFNDPYCKYYNHHVAFKGYPAVGMSWEGANAFCAYMTDKYGKLKLKGSDGKWREVNLKFRLPTIEEWEIASCGKTSLDTAFVNGYAGNIFYPRDHKGRFRFNHKLGDGDYCGYTGGDARDFEGYMITAPVESFPPDKHLGLHNLAGNVAEMTSEKGKAKGGSWNHLQDDCRVAAVQNYEKPQCWLGFRIVAEQVPSCRIPR